MNKETKTFVEGLLHKYNTHKVVDTESLMFNNVHKFKLANGDTIELEDVDAFKLIGELLWSLDITEEDNPQPTVTLTQDILDNFKKSWDKYVNSTTKVVLQEGKL